MCYKLIGSFRICFHSLYKVAALLPKFQGVIIHLRDLQNPDEKRISSQSAFSRKKFTLTNLRFTTQINPLVELVKIT